MWLGDVRSMVEGNVKKIPSTQQSLPMSKVLHLGQSVIYKLQILISSKGKKRSQFFWSKCDWGKGAKHIKISDDWDEVDIKGGSGVTGEGWEHWSLSTLQRGLITGTSKINMISDKSRSPCRNKSLDNMHTDIQRPVSCVWLCGDLLRSGPGRISMLIPFLFLCTWQIQAQQHRRLKKLNTFIHYPLSTYDAWLAGLNGLCTELFTIYQCG